MRRTRWGMPQAMGSFSTSAIHRIDCCLCRPHESWLSRSVLAALASRWSVVWRKFSTGASLQGRTLRSAQASCWNFPKKVPSNPLQRSPPRLSRRAEALGISPLGIYRRDPAAHEGVRWPGAKRAMCSSIAVVPRQPPAAAVARKALAPRTSAWGVASPQLLAVFDATCPGREACLRVPGLERRIRTCTSRSAPRCAALPTSSRHAPGRCSCTSCRPGC